MYDSRTEKLRLPALAASACLCACLLAGCVPGMSGNDQGGAVPDAQQTPIAAAGDGDAGEGAGAGGAQTQGDASLSTEGAHNAGSSGESAEAKGAGPGSGQGQDFVQLDTVPAYAGALSVEVNGNVPEFTEADRTRGDFEEYSDLDDLGRAGTAFARISRKTMPTEERTEDLTYNPTGWQVATYDFVDYRYLYNRCHLIAWSLAAESNNPNNLITGTRTLNMEGMRPFEEEVSRYVYRTNNSVLYRVTPIFWADNLVASGVHMEAESVEDGGAGVSFNVYCYNVEPGVSINYASGESKADGTKTAQEYEPSDEEQAADFVINRRSRIYHYPDCESVAETRDYNKAYFQGTLEELQEQYPGEEGWRLCNRCREKHGEGQA